jgi:hypothetical protein
LSLTSGFAGDRRGCKSFAAVHGAVVEGQAGTEAGEVGDEVGMAVDEAELAAELLNGVGHITPYPSPLPVRERPVQHVPNHEDVGSSEHQIRLSEGLIAKFVQLLRLEHIPRRAKMKKPPAWWLLLSPLL